MLNNGIISAITVKAQRNVLKIKSNLKFLQAITGQSNTRRETGPKSNGQLTLNGD
jgi:hypothetical protein